MDRIQEMTLFAALAGQTSFTGVARHVGLSTATVTRAVVSLESRLGILLVVRTTRNMRLTEAGQRFAEDCRRLLADLAEAENAAAGVHALPAGTLTVTAPQMFGALHVTPVLTRFLSEYPAVDIRAILVDRVVSMLDEGVDVAVRIGALRDSSLTAIRVGSVRRMVCASPVYLAQHGTPRHPDDLQQHATISTSAPERPPQWAFRVDDQDYSVNVASRLSLTSFQASINAALQHWGLTQVPHYQIREHLQNGRLVCVLEDFEIAPEPVHVVYSEGRRGSSRVRSFVDFCVSALREDLQFEAAG
ncbi:LysR family transcriptional regulator [Pseudomonas syringae pv. tomato]|uniref:LysR family transcriptional regulator n=1 Tax=Pseudomonas syringae pv. tomato TaxID=323 RepID=A0AB36KLC6_PSEUB|nr:MULTISPECIES: LysR substrate-binding domain-containing protein [Pseudomonas syringae group]KPB76143.1 Transcriptional regulator [Pseudomonas syringae pv. maculicola]KPW38371.1 Transcriptional regulator, LysR family [Pseudomonas syringae pv. apii]MBI6847497.1 LysR family transcriptional regulator [Pseudomonas syringae]MBX6510990.1 LysR family transcriptional regulator [Pseudomonas syringae pv. tomato]OPE57444.1 LysR family transcriptional regulator [Pseudomonas syringae pv. tomato]